MVDTILLLALAALAPNDFSMTLPMSPETPEGQRLIAARALEICGGRYPQLGRYRFSGTEPLTGNQPRESRFEVHQELTCLDAPPPAPFVEPAPADWQPTEEDVRHIREMTARYFSLIDSGHAQDALGLWNLEQQGAIPLAERIAQLEDFRRGAGSPGEHRIIALTWYVNPEGAPVPGIYVAADYDRSYSELAFNCGYLIWFREADDRYVITREETNSFPRSADATPAIIEEARTRLRCRAP